MLLLFRLVWNLGSYYDEPTMILNCHAQVRLPRARLPNLSTPTKHTNSITEFNNYVNIC